MSGAGDKAVGAGARLTGLKLQGLKGGGWDGNLSVVRGEGTWDPSRYLQVQSASQQHGPWWNVFPTKGSPFSCIPVGSGFLAP